MAYYGGYSSLVSEIDLLEIERLYLKGVSAKKIADKYGMHTSSMCYRLRKMGLMPQQKRTYTKFDSVPNSVKQEIRKKYNSVENHREKQEFIKEIKFFDKKTKKNTVWKRRWQKSIKSPVSVRGLMEEYGLSRSIIERILKKKY